MTMGYPVSSVTRILTRERMRVRGRSRSRVREEKRYLLVLKMRKGVQKPRNSEAS